MIYERNKRYWLDVTVNGSRYREALTTKNWQEAKQFEKDRLLEIQQGKAGARGPAAKGR